MSGRQATRPRHFEMENERPRNRRERRDSPQQDEERSSRRRYEREGNLSPLRSPLRTEREFASGDNKKMQRERRPQRYSEGRKESGWKNVEQQSMPIGNDEEYPPLDNSRMTPEQHLPPASWATMVENDDEEEEQSHINRYKRRLLLTDSGEKSKNNSKKDYEKEQDQGVITRRTKQIDYGKNTLGYERYSDDVPKIKRTKAHPKTPNKLKKVSRRSWDMQVKLWRRQLHLWDPQNNSADSLMSDSSSEASIETLGSIQEVEMSETSSNTPSEAMTAAMAHSLAAELHSDLTSDLMNFAVVPDSAKEQSSSANQKNGGAGFDIKACLQKDDDADFDL